MKKKLTIAFTMVTLLINSVVPTFALSANTGDDTDMTPYIIMVVLAAVIIVGYIVYKIIKKKKK
ncbi:MAG: hypothetical protein PHH04_00810 [Thomasclavelia sp.]|nr:hypothetical protein [Thomasclavelia sp.]